MAVIFESENFLVQSAEAPLVDRMDGGHLTIDPKFTASTRQDLTPSQAIELMRLTMVAGEAMAIVMNEHGVDVGRINYQDNGNWSVFKPAGPQLHYHLYGRARSAVHQPYGQTLHMPHKDEHPEIYQGLQPLTGDDVRAIRKNMIGLFQQTKYRDAAWQDHSSGIPQQGAGLIVKAVATDADIIARIGRISVGETHRESSPEKEMNAYLDSHYHEDAISEELADPHNHYYLMYVDEQPAGFSKIVFGAEHANIQEKDVAKLDRIYFLREFQGMGLGAELLQFNINLSKRHHQSAIWLFTWTGNHKAIAFYRRAGFSITGNDRFRLSENHYNPQYQMLLRFSLPENHQD